MEIRPAKTSKFMYTASNLEKIQNVKDDGRAAVEVMAKRDRDQEGAAAKRSCGGGMQRTWRRNTENMEERSRDDGKEMHRIWRRTLRRDEDSMQERAENAEMRCKNRDWKRTRLKDSH